MPSLSDCLISFTFHKETDFRMCAGAIDGTHIPIRSATESYAEYLNRKGYHSILMQALVDARYIYRDAIIGWPGSVHDARVFRTPKFSRKGMKTNFASLGFPKGLTWTSHLWSVLHMPCASCTMYVRLKKTISWNFGLETTCY